LQLTCDVIEFIDFKNKTKQTKNGQKGLLKEQDDNQERKQGQGLKNSQNQASI
jgi:hypothetical protein